jgi:hypothetical protein
MLNELCEGDVVSFSESIERWYFNRNGYRILANQNQSQFVIATVTGKTKCGRIRLENCRIDRNHSVRNIKKTTRMPTPLFRAYANLQLRSKGERGQLVDCSPASTHPDAQKHFNMTAADANSRRTYKLDPWNNDLDRAIHDDNARELKRDGTIDKH